MESLSEESASRLDTLYLVVAILLIGGAMFAFYYFDRQPLFGHQLVFLERLGILIAGTVAGIAVGYRAEVGQQTWGAIVGSRIEMRKVVWPSRQQSVQITLMVAVVVLLTALFLWLVDSTLLFAIKYVTGSPS